MSDKVYKNILFNKERDEDVLDWLESQENQAGTVRDALRFYMAHKGITAEITIADVLDEVRALSERVANIKTVQGEKPTNYQEPADLVAKLKNFGT